MDLSGKNSMYGWQLCPGLWIVAWHAKRQQVRPFLVMGDGPKAMGKASLVYKQWLATESDPSSLLLSRC